MRSLSVLVAAALVVAVVVWWCWSDGLLPATTGGRPAPAPALAAAATGDTVATSAAADRLAVAGVVDAAAGGAADAAAAGDATLTTITVVDGEDGQPVAGAEVLWTDAASNRAMQQSLGGTLWWRDYELVATIGHPDQEAARFGHRTRSDADGRVQLALGQYATLVGHHGDRYGQLWVATGLSPPAAGHRLVLERDLVVSALVVDYAGTPVVAAPVVVVPTDERGTALRGVPFGCQVLTDSAGLAEIRHLQQWRREFAQSGQGNRSVQWRVRCLWSPYEDPGVTFAVEDPPGQPIRLQLPPTGRIRLTAMLGGHPDAALAHVQLIEQIQNGVDYDGARSMPGRRDADGWLRWQHVPLGRRYRVTTEEDGLYRYPEFAGPTAPGEEVEVQLQSAAEAIVWCGRLLDRAQRPFANVRAMLHWDGPAETVRLAMATDGDGRFSVHLMDRSEDPEEHVVDFAQIFLGDMEPMQASVELGACTLEPGVRDLGDLVLAPAPLVVGGHFVAAGQVVKVDADLRVECWRMPDEVDGSTEPQWIDVPNLLSKFDELGHFEIRGTCPTGPLRLHVTPRNALPVGPVEFGIGVRIAIEVQLAPSLDVRVLMPARDATRCISATLESAAIDPATGRAFSRLAEAFWLSGATRLYWPAVPAGTYSLVVRHRLVGTPLLRLDDVVVPTPDADAARLQELDLREQLRAVRLRLVDVDGALVNEVSGIGMLTEPEAPGEAWRVLGLWNPAVEVLLPTQLGKVLVACSGYRPALLPDGVDDIELQMEPWPTQLLTFPGLPSPPPGCKVKVRLHAADADGLGTYQTNLGGWRVGEFLRPSSYVAITDGRAEVAIGDGDHQVQLVVEGPDAVLPVPRVHPATVRAGAGPVAVSVPLDAWLETCREVLSKGR